MKLLLGYAAFFLVAVATHAEDAFNPRQADSPLSQAEQVVAGTDRGGFVGVPVPFADPAIGSGLAAMVGYLYPLDKTDLETPESFTAVGGFWSDNGSQGVAAIQRLYLQQDKYRVSFGGGSAKVNTDFFGVGNDAGQQDRSVPITQEGDVFFGQVSVSTWQDLYVGLGVGYAELETRGSLSLALLPGTPIDINTDVRLMSYSASLMGDWRDNVYTPSAGSLLEIDASFRERDGVTSGQYQKYSAAYNHYRALTDRQTLALRASSCLVRGDAPFFDLCLFGQSQDLRGYSVGRFRDRAQITFQVEYRHQLSDRWGGVLFVGVGNIAESFGDFSADSRLTSFGAGVRFRVSADPRINLRVDYARGEEEEALHISIGEAF